MVSRIDMDNRDGSAIKFSLGPDTLSRYQWVVSHYATSSGSMRRRGDSSTNT